MTKTRTRVEWRRMGEDALGRGVPCIGPSINEPCDQQATWCREWQSPNMAAPAFWYFCEEHAAQQERLDKGEAPRKETVTDLEIAWAVAKARVFKAAEDVVRVAYGERGHRVITLAAAHGELRDALRDMDTAGTHLYEAGMGVEKH